MPPRFVMFSVYTAQPLGLPRDVADRLAAELDRADEPDLAGRVRYSLLHEALVTFNDDREREVVAETLERMVTAGEKDETVSNLARNLRLRLAGHDVLPGFFRE